MLQPEEIPPLAPKNLDDLLGQALDGSQLAAARRVFFSRSWDLIAGDADMLWGEYRLRHTIVFRPLVRIADAYFSCSCRAPQPCKHALALLLFARQSSERMQVNHEPPLWVKERLSEKPPPKKEIITDAASRQLARDARWEKRKRSIQGGLDELDQWLQDVVRQGLVQAGGMQTVELERMSARLVDAGLSGPGKQLRLLSYSLDSESWTDQATDLIARLYLFLRAFRQIENLPPDQVRDLLHFAGVNTRKEDVLQQKGIKDHWLVVGVQTGEEDRLRFRRVWLFGEKSKQAGLLLDYAWGSQDFLDRWTTGAAVKGELVYYPGSQPIRAVFRNASPSQEPYDGPHALADLASLMEAQSRALQKNPLLANLPVMLETVRPVQLNGQLFFLIDKEGHEIPLADHEAVNWILLAISGGHPISLFGEWDGRVFHPLSAISGQRLIGLS